MKTKLFCNLHPVLDLYCVNAVKIDLHFVNYKKKILSTTLCLNKNSIEEFKKIGHCNKDRYSSVIKNHYKPIKVYGMGNGGLPVLRVV